MNAGYSSAQQKTSDWIVAGLVLAALLLGFWLKAFVEGQTHEVNTGGVTAFVPAKWVTESTTQTLLDKPAAEPHRVLSTWDPLSPGTRYHVSLLPHNSDVDLPSMASLRNFQRAQALTAYRVLDQTPVTLNGRDGYKVQFAFVDAAAKDRVPVVYEGVDYFFAEDGHVLVVSLETQKEVSSVLPRFQEFAVAVSLGGAQ